MQEHIFGIFQRVVLGVLYAAGVARYAHMRGLGLGLCQLHELRHGLRALGKLKALGVVDQACHLHALQIGRHKDHVAIGQLHLGHGAI